MNEAFKYSSVKIKKELIHIALKEFVEKKRRLKLMDLEGKIEFEAGFNHKRMWEGS